MGLYNRLGQIEAQAATLCFAAQTVIDAIEALEDPLLIFWGNTNALVGHIGKRHIVLDSPANADAAAIRAVLKCI